MTCKILFSNLGYARGIDGSLSQHLRRFNRNFYCAQDVQEQVLSQVKSIIAVENPDLCCFVEIDQGSFHSAYFNQLHALADDEYRYFDIAGKYGEDSRLARLPLHKGKSNAWLARHDFEFQRLYFANGTKRLIYKMRLPNDVNVFFAHFSLQKDVRFRQFKEVHKLVESSNGNIIILADFNIMQGFSELKPLLEDTDLKVLNKEDEHTFFFHRRKLTLDLCMCSANLVPQVNLRTIQQPYSDHAALLVEF